MNLSDNTARPQYVHCIFTPPRNAMDRRTEAALTALLARADSAADSLQSYSPGRIRAECRAHAVFDLILTGAIGEYPVNPDLLQRQLLLSVCEELVLSARAQREAGLTALKFVSSGELEEKRLTGVLAAAIEAKDRIEVGGKDESVAVDAINRILRMWKCAPIERNVPKPKAEGVDLVNKYDDGDYSRTELLEACERYAKHYLLNLYFGEDGTMQEVESEDNADLLKDWTHAFYRAAEKEEARVMPQLFEPSPIPDTAPHVLPMIVAWMATASVSLPDFLPAEPFPLFAESVGTLLALADDAGIIDQHPGREWSDFLCSVRAGTIVRR